MVVREGKLKPNSLNKKGKKENLLVQFISEEIVLASGTSLAQAFWKGLQSLSLPLEQIGSG